MSQYPQHDQRGYFDEGYGAYSSATPNPYDSPIPAATPNPYEQEHQAYQPIHPDPFAIPQQPPPHPSTYHSPPPITSPPPAEYLNPFQGGYHPSSSPQPTIQPSPTPSPYSLHDRPSYELHDNGSHENLDTGDIPLLRRDGPGSSMPMPGGYGPVSDEDQSENNIRYGRIPQRVPRRYKTIKKVELFHGNLVLDPKVPSKLLNMCQQRNNREFTHMRYSAATCDPNDFKEMGFTLRQVLYDPPSPKAHRAFYCHDDV